MMPFCAARARLLSASFKVSAIALASLATMASSILRTDVRISVRRGLLIAFLRIVTRPALRADLVFAIGHPKQFSAGVSKGRAGRTPPAHASGREAKRGRSHNAGGRGRQGCREGICRKARGGDSLVPRPLQRHAAAMSAKIS